MSKATLKIACDLAEAALATDAAMDANNTLLREVSLAGGTVKDSYDEAAMISTITILVGDIVVASATDPDLFRATVKAVRQLLESVK